jgi:N-acetylmuramoyl-L-alanine amidase
MEKIIVIDPGHGGRERGAIGAKGLNESEVNLGVALSLWGLLKGAGARPVLTRSSNTTVYTGEEFCIKEDLQVRSDLSNRYRADLFISIHHDSSANRKKNGLTIYYKMSDPGQSRDIAHEVCKALKNKLRLKTFNVHSGNYHVLRNTNAPAILGEASFMTNKKNEAMLSFNRTIGLEAEGYFIGVLNYFQKGVPRITGPYPENVTLPNTRPEISARLIPGQYGTAIDPSSIKVSLDSKAVTDFSFQNEELISFVPKTPLQNSRHQFCITARNRLGNISEEKCASFSISVPPGAVSVSPVFPIIPADGMASTPLDIEVLDALKRPVIDGTEVEFSSTGGRFLSPTALTKNGRTRAILISDEKAQAVSVTVKSGNTVSQCAVEFGLPEEALFMATIRDPSGNPVKRAGLLIDSQPIALSDSNGFIYVSMDAVGETPCMVIKKGYYPLTLCPSLSPGKLTVENLVLEPVDSGIFFNRKIVLDPAGASTRPMSVVVELKRRIENAGGNGIITWENPPAPSVQERAVKAGRENADIFLSIKAAGNGLSAGYYHKSSQGQELAKKICEKLGENRTGKSGSCETVTSTHYVIIQTAMPAVRISLPESLTTSSGNTADRIYEALREIFAGIY